MFSTGYHSACSQRNPVHKYIARNLFLEAFTEQLSFHRRYMAYTVLVWRKAHQTRTQLSVIQKLFEQPFPNSAPPTRLYPIHPVDRAQQET